jgi:hypothetical protein
MQPERESVQQFGLSVLSSGNDDDGGPIAECVFLILTVTFALITEIVR